MMSAAPSILAMRRALGHFCRPQWERRMRFQPPQWFPVIDEVTVSVALLFTTMLLLVAMILWVH